MFKLLHFLLLILVLQSCCSAAHRNNSAVIADTEREFLNFIGSRTGSASSSSSSSDDNQVLLLAGDANYTAPKTTTPNVSLSSDEVSVTFLGARLNISSLAHSRLKEKYGTQAIFSLQQVLSYLATADDFHKELTSKTDTFSEKYISELRESATEMHNQFICLDIHLTCHQAVVPTQTFELMFADSAKNFLTAKQVSDKLYSFDLTLLQLGLLECAKSVLRL